MPDETTTSADVDETTTSADFGDTTPPTGRFLFSRIVVTWIELTVVGLAGTFLGTSIGGPPAFIVYLATTLLSVGVLLYNVNALLTTRLRRADHTP
jgi:membrane protein DedA with SNARE-associated domain